MVIRTLKTVDQVIDVGCGGTAAAAKLVRKYGLTCRDTAVSNWRATGRLPSKFWLIFCRELSAKRMRALPALFGILDPATLKVRA